jgi:hypothetical protein
MTPRSLASVLVLYQQHLFKELDFKVAETIHYNTIRAFSYYILPGWGGSIPKKRRLQPTDIDAAWQFMETVTLSQLKDAPAIQEERFQQLQTSNSSKQKYGFKLRQLLQWCQQQEWWPYPVAPKPPKNIAPPYRHGHGGVGSEPVSRRANLPSYALLKRDTPAKLQQQLDELYKFFTAAHQPKRPTGPIKPDVANHYIEYIRQVLGWFHRYARPVYDDQGRVIALSQDEQVPLVSMEGLSLDLLIPRVALRNRNSDPSLEQAAEQATEYIDAWICHLLNFLETERQHNSRSLYSVLTGVHALARFQYHQDTADLQYRDIPILGIVRRHQSELNRRIKTEDAASNLWMQWLELPEVLERIVKPLREECAYRTCTGHIRRITAIAHSFQLFLIWACLTFRPPRRQQEFRKLQIGLSCSIKRPKNLKKGQFIHPLPDDRDEYRFNGYLYKESDGCWYMDMTPESYKTGAKYGHQKLVIPNSPLADGKGLYDYLEAFLYGYYRDSKGNWQSGGQLAETPATEGQWYSLRMAFEPTHNHVFGQPKAGGVLNTSQFCKMIRASSNRLTGQRVFPHLLRDIVATWFLINKYTTENVQSLAYAMGQSEEMLRKMYDRRTTQQKNQPIEDALTPIVQKFIT